VNNMAQKLESNPIDYQVELSLLYRERIIEDAWIFDDDTFIHGHNCKCCTACYDDPSRRFEERKQK
jgi:hypothetical protein